MQDNLLCIKDFLIIIKELDDRTESFIECLKSEIEDNENHTNQHRYFDGGKFWLCDNILQSYSDKLRMYELAIEGIKKGCDIYEF